MEKSIEIVQPFIVQSAVCIGNYCLPCIHHYDHLMVDIMHILDNDEDWLPYQKEQVGYIDQEGKFYSEQEAVKIAIECRQLTNINTSVKLSQLLWNKSSSRKVVTAALRYEDYIFTAPRHNHPIHDNWFNHLPVDGYYRKYPKEKIEKGFVDQFGYFMTEEEALELAIKANQMKNKDNAINPNGKLSSWDLY